MKFIVSHNGTKNTVKTTTLSLYALLSLSRCVKYTILTLVSFLYF